MLAALLILNVTFLLPVMLPLPVMVAVAVPASMLLAHATSKSVPCFKSVVPSLTVNAGVIAFPV